MVHKYFGGTVPEVGAETQAEASLRATAEGAIAAFGPAFDELNFSEALKTLWNLVAETDGYLTANAPWKMPADRSENDQTALQARVLSTAAEAIRVITALVYPILPDAASKVWQQLGQGSIADAAKQAFLTDLAWGGLKPGTRLGEPSPLFPRAEKDAITRMQNLEDENNKNAIEAASNKQGAEKSAPEAPMSALGINPDPSAPPAGATVKHAPAATSVQSPASTEDGPAGTATTPVTTAPSNPEKPVDTAHVHSVPAELASSRLASTPAEAPANKPLDSKEVNQDPPTAPTLPAHITIDDFAKVELRVAQILVAERIPKADKLLRLEVDLGYEKRQILAGIAQYYEPEKLIGRKIVIVANLAPRKMRGLESNGMLLAASLPPDGVPVLAGFLEDVPLGARLK
jgi:methionyl-tRNA synthetase